jgi:hypothetical protein
LIVAAAPTNTAISSSIITMPAQPSTRPAVASPLPPSPVRRIWLWAVWPRMTAGIMVRPPVNGCSRPQASDATASGFVRGMVRGGSQAGTATWPPGRSVVTAASSA